MGGGGPSPRPAVHPSQQRAPVPQQCRPGRHGAMLAFLHFLRLLVTALENFMVPLCSKPLAQSYQRGRGRRGPGAMPIDPSTAQAASLPCAPQLASFHICAFAAAPAPHMHAVPASARGVPSPAAPASPQRACQQL